ncbi:hypothetical protein HJA63_003014 [Vibrio vulnificus]|nr:hypothetical protein [Vibrio vulnificus]HAS8115766.1 hypothetical protein [Vibrio vulnificus]
MNKVYIHYEGKFSQNLYPWSSLDVISMGEILKSNNVCVEFISLNDIPSRGLSSFKNKTIIFGGSQNAIEKSVIEDYTYWLEKNGCKVIPSYESLRALENKGFQALASECFLPEKYLPYYYNTSSNIPFEDNFVYKLTDGAGSNGVFIPSSYSSLKRRFFVEISKRASIVSIVPYFKQLVKRVVKWRYIKEKEEYYKPRVNMVMQKFIHGLDCDYKVLVFGNRYFVLKRNIAEGDFRASGSNLFEVVSKAPVPVLELAKEVSVKLKSPYCSLDISLDSKGSTRLIEYQCTHFGPYTYLSATHVNIFVKDTWMNVPWQHVSLEEIYAYAIIDYISEEN